MEPASADSTNSSQEEGALTMMKSVRWSLSHLLGLGLGLGLGLALGLGFGFGSGGRSRTYYGYG